jgi:membrane protein involved in D-alanine export
MIPYADFLYFGLLLYPVVPTVLLGFFGRANRAWLLLVMLLVLAAQYYTPLNIRSQIALREIWMLLGYAIYEWCIVWLFLRSHARQKKSRWSFYGAVAAGLLPLATAKFLPVIAPGNQVGFLGISYVTFRALDVIFSINDRLITTLPFAEFFAFVFFFPTISAGPIDRYRRFDADWKRKRTRADFLADADSAVHHLFRGFFYKFIIAALISRFWMDRAANGTNLGSLASYMYAYSFYLFFDFAGYSAFAIGVSYLFGIHTPENFDKPFLARNIRDFWNRWHMTLSFWFRDHVYMRFLLAATRGKWFKNKHLASYLGFFLSFGLMGIWHGTEPHFILYGLYHACLLCAYDLFARWNKTRRWWGDGPLWRITNVFITFNFVCFGLLIFSGHFGAREVTRQNGVLENVTCEEISGWAWDKHDPTTPISVDIFDGKSYVDTVRADIFSENLRDAGYGNGQHAFRIATPARFRDGRAHDIAVRIAETKRDLKGSPRLLTCPEH